MEIQNLVDRLEQVLNDSTRVPMSAYLMVNEDKIYNIVDQLRITVPDEIKRANRIESEKERILAQAHEEAERIRELSKQEATELVNREVITSAAQQRADHILERARRDAQTLRQEADVYVVSELNKLEEDLLRSLAVVRNGLHQLQVGTEQESSSEEEVVETVESKAADSE